MGKTNANKEKKRKKQLSATRAIDRGREEKSDVS